MYIDDFGYILNKLEQIADSDSSIFFSQEEFFINKVCTLADKDMLPPKAYEGYKRICRYEVRVYPKPFKDEIKGM